MKYEEIRKALVEALSEVCENCGQGMSPEQLQIMNHREVEKYFMPKLIPALEALEKQGGLSLNVCRVRTPTSEGLE